MLKMIKNFLKEEDGLGTVEIVVIIAVLVGLALIFRKAIFQFVNQIFDRIFSSGGEVTDAPSGDEIKDRNISPTPTATP